MTLILKKHFVKEYYQQGQLKGCPYMVVEVNISKYIKVKLISAKRFKNKIFRIFAV